ncbi:MAG: hypothetical protein GX072_00825, partial [Lysinibacillus sp.]|nr:hypothetical protein [Lysinibacillus sp.]
MSKEKTEKIVKKLETQLKTTSRQLVQFNSEEDALQYISNTFREKLSADFVGIIVKNGKQLNIKTWSGQPISLTDAFPMPIDRCSPNLFLNSKTYEEVSENYNCDVKRILLKEKIPTWFTFPLKNELNLFGFCIIGYFQKVKLYQELETIFDEFGKDVAIAMLYQREKRHKQRLQELLNYQQALVKETLVGNTIDGITNTLSKLLSNTVILLDRFFRPISYRLETGKENLLNELVELATYEIVQKQSSKLWRMTSFNDLKVAVYPVDIGGDLLGYLVIDVTNVKVDDYYLLSIDVARNIYSVQFMKQKLILDTKEQMKDSFINKLLTGNISDYEYIFQYANLFNWDIDRSHFVAIISFSFPKDCTLNLLEIESYRTVLWERLKNNIAIYYPEVLIVSKDGEMIVIAPAENINPKDYWSKFFHDIKKWVMREEEKAQVFLAIGGTTSKITDYYVSYLQA